MKHGVADTNRWLRHNEPVYKRYDIGPKYECNLAPDQTIASIFEDE
jgi:hypothetical protein